MSDTRKATASINYFLLHTMCYGIDKSQCITLSTCNLLEIGQITQMLKKIIFRSLTQKTAIITLPKLNDMAFDIHFPSKINC